MKEHIAESMHRMRGISIWLILFGALLVLLGMTALAAPWIFTLTSVLIFGWLLMIGGAAGTISAILSKGWHGFAVYLLIGVLDVVVGFLLVSKPLQGAAVVTLILAVLFLAGGFGRVLSALVLRFPNWGWAVVGGLISILLGGMIWGEWPESSLWVIGTFVGIEMLFRGWAWVMLGLTIRRVVPPTA